MTPGETLGTLHNIHVGSNKTKQHMPTFSFACSAPPACHLSALVPALSLPLVFERLLRDLGITGPPGEHLPYWDQIPYTRFLFDFW